MNISVGLIVKDGHRYLTEWLSWYMCAGFTKFYIAAHNATEETLQWLNLASKNNLVFFYRTGYRRRDVDATYRI